MSIITYKCKISFQICFAELWIWSNDWQISIIPHTSIKVYLICIYFQLLPRYMYYWVAIYHDKNTIQKSSSISWWGLKQYFKRHHSFLYVVSNDIIRFIMILTSVGKDLQDRELIFSKGTANWHKNTKLLEYIEYILEIHNLYPTLLCDSHKVAFSSLKPYS